MATFRAYTTKEVREAAEAYGVDPDFAEAVYAAESSRGTNPKAMTARTVKRKRDSTIVRGPFQLEDGTTADLIRDNKLGNVNIDDPDVHLDLAMRLMRKLQDQFGGDLSKMAQAYLGGPGSVGRNVTDELGTTPAAYSNRILAEIGRLQSGRGDNSSLAMNDTLDPSEFDDLGMLDMPPTPFNHGASIPANDVFGIPEMAAVPVPQDIQRDPLGLPMFLSGRRPKAEPVDITNDEDLNRYVASLVDDELQGRDFVNA